MDSFDSAPEPPRAPRPDEAEEVEATDATEAVSTAAADAAEREIHDPEPTEPTEGVGRSEAVGPFPPSSDRFAPLVDDEGPLADTAPGVVEGAEAPSEPGRSGGNDASAPFETPAGKPSAEDLAQREREDAQVLGSMQAVPGASVHADHSSGHITSIGSISGSQVVMATLGSSGLAGITASGLSELATVPPDDGRVLMTDELVEAGRRLGDDHLLLLVGPHGSGKLFAALHLLGLQQERTGPARGISPTAGTPEIVAAVDQADSTYVIDGTLLFGNPGDRRSHHELGVLAGHLRAKTSYLVASVHAEAALAERLPYALPWTGPDPCVLFEHLRTTIVPPAGSGTRVADLGAEQLEPLLARLSAADRPGPALVTRLVGMLAEGTDPDEVCAAVDGLSGEAATDEVTEYLGADDDHDEQGRGRVLYAAVVAFLGGLDEAVLEQEYQELRRCVGSAPGTTVAAGKDPAASGIDPRSDVPHGRTLTKERRGRFSTTLLVRSAPGASLRPDRTVDLPSEAHRRAVVEQLWSCYGPDLWEPLDRWITGAPHRLDAFGADRLARGVGCLAGSSFVAAWRVLDRWWGGTRTQRLVAVRAASYMATDERLAPAVLAHTLTGYEPAAESVDERWWTSDITLGGPLGTVFPAVAVPALWHRLARQPVGGPAGLALWHLLAGDGASPALSTVILRFIQAEIREVSGAERSKRLAWALEVVGHRFGADERRARAALALAGHADARRTLAAVLRTTLRDGEVRATAAELLVAILRQARVESRQGPVADLLVEIANYRHSGQSARLQRELRRLVRLTLDGESDPVLERAFARPRSAVLATGGDGGGNGGGNGAPDDPGDRDLDDVGARPAPSPRRDRQVWPTPDGAGR